MVARQTLHPEKSEMIEGILCEMEKSPRSIL